MTKKPRRDPGETIKTSLRREINFGCPVRFPDGGGCGSPVLTYHHFDPPWARAFVHNPAGMIALCPQHHAQADGEMWTVAQLREMKRSPFVDDQLKVRWPWQPETLVVKVGPSLVLGNGSPIRLHGRPILGFRPESIAGLGVRTVVFNSDIRDSAGAPWLRIDDGWFDLRLERTTDVEFTPQTKTLQAKHDDNTYLSLRVDRRPYEDVAADLRGFMTNPEIAESAARSIERCGAIDSDGRITLMEVGGSFRTNQLEVVIQGDRMTMTSDLTGVRETFDVPSYVVDGERRAIVRKHKGPEVFSIG